MRPQREMKKTVKGIRIFPGWEQRSTKRTVRRVLAGVLVAGLCEYPALDPGVREPVAYV